MILFFLYYILRATFSINHCPGVLRNFPLSWVPLSIEDVYGVHVLKTMSSMLFPTQFCCSAFISVNKK